MNDPGARPDGGSETSVGSARETAVRDLTQGAVGGNLTLGEYAERAAAIEEAATADEIHDAVQGLPEEAAGTVHRGCWIVALLGGAEQRGRWRLSRRLASARAWFNA